jgi:hypothetical protein
MRRQGYGCRQVFFDGAGSEVELAGDATGRPVFAAREAMNFIDLISLEHGCGYKLMPGARPEGCCWQEAEDLGTEVAGD